MKLVCYLDGDIITYNSYRTEQSVIVESQTLGDDDVRRVYKMYQQQKMQSRL